MWLGANFETDKKGTGDMKILMIGNGFDLEHGLPTKYTDFWIISLLFGDIMQGSIRDRLSHDAMLIKATILKSYFPIRRITIK